MSAELVASEPAAPEGVTFKRIDRAYGSVEIPEGAGWELVENQLQHPDGSVIMLQDQSGISPDQLDDYLASYADVQKRDAPKYTAPAATKGRLAGFVAARVEGRFDNGTKFVTRDYLLFTGTSVVLISGRTPASNAAALTPIVDRIARSTKRK